MQILGFGLVRPEEDLQDYQILFREVAASKHSNKGKLRDYYYAALDIKSEKSSGGKPVTIPQAVKAVISIVQMGNIISVRFVERYCACRENIPTFTHWMLSMPSTSRFVIGIPATGSYRLPFPEHQRHRPG